MKCAECKEILVAYLEGLLEEAEKQAVAEHLKDCSSCQAEEKQLTNLRDRLIDNGKVLAQSDLEDDVLNRIVQEQNVRLKAADKAAAGLKLRRIIMKSPITRMAVAAAVLIVAALGVHYVMAPSITFADVVEPILNARTVILDLILGGDETNPVMQETIVGSRIRRTMSNLPNLTQILDLDTGDMLVLDTEAKTATYVDIKGSVAEGTRNYVASLRQIIRRLQNDQGSIERLGDQVIDGQKAVGFAARWGNDEITIWADPKTALPIRIEIRIGHEGAAILKNFQFDVPVEDSLVSMEVPAGYALQETKFDLSGATEKDFVQSLRIWAEIIRDGTFPEAVGSENTMKEMPVLVQKLTQMKVSEEEGTEMGMRFARGMLFHQTVNSQGEWHYAGGGVKVGDADKAIFWYRPEGSETYRVIYGDLSVKDVTPENLPE